MLNSARPFVFAFLIMFFVIYFLFFFKKGKKSTGMGAIKSLFTRDSSNMEIPDVDILISTTHTLPGYRIEKIKGMDFVVVAQGTGIISDWLAGWSDIAGTRSKTYTNKLSDPILYGYKKLMERAISMGGNALIGVRHSLIPVSPDGKSSVVVFTFEGTIVICVDEETELKPIIDDRKKEPYKPLSVMSAQTVADDVSGGAPTVP